MTTTMIKMSRSAILLLATLPGCPLVDVEAEVPEVCLTYPNLQVQSPAVGSLSQSFVFDDLSAVHDVAKQDASLSFVRAEVRVTSGIENLAFIDAVHVVVSSTDPATPLPPLTVYDCSGNCAPDGNALEVPAALVHNAIDYLRAGSLKIDLEFDGQIPAASWTMDIDVCMKGSAGYTVSP
ncbi:MAG: hypothetical protein E6J91_02595 [Deltaproteobacteria bacterium]|nr:MAG: hypothetical protein E6J91_02595 [Deltaproteobacteria bacterium]